MSNVSRNDRLYQVCADVLGVPVESLSDQSSPESIASWDSVNHLGLIMAIEAEFGVEFDPIELMELRTIGALDTRLRNSASA